MRRNHTAESGVGKRIVLRQRTTTVEENDVICRYRIILAHSSATADVNYAPSSLSTIQDARRVIANSAIRTPLLRLNVPLATAEIYLKLENLQPIGSFKIRGAASAISRVPRANLSHGVVTASAGNTA